MGVRESMNKRPMIAGGVTVIFVAAALVFVVFQLLGLRAPAPDMGGDPEKGFFTVDDGRTWFIMMTALGRQLFDAVYACCIRNGAATIEVSRALSGRDGCEHPEEQRCKAVPIASLLVAYFGWFLPGAEDLYLWNPDDYRDQMDWPIGDRAHWELRVADPGVIDAPMFQAGDVLAEIES